MTALQYGPEVAQITGKYAAVAARIPANSQVLDVGCYTGGLLAYLKGQGHRVLGLEQDRAAAQIAQSLGVDVLTGDLEDPAFLAGLEVRPDVILLLDVLEHLRDPTAALRELRGMLRPGGRVLVTGPNVGYWALRKSLLLGKWEYGDAGPMDRTHLRFFTRSTWIDLLEQTGFRVARFEPVDAILPFQLKVRRSARLSKIFGDLAVRVARRWPTLFAMTFLLEAVPDNP